VEGEGESGLTVRGNRCPKGEAYGREEAASPKRTVTAVVRTDSEAFPYVPVRTDKPLLRELCAALLSELSGLEVRLPAALGDVLIESFRESGVKVLLTRTLPPNEVPPVG
jgi:CxxC motif-containing protein